MDNGDIWSYKNFLSLRFFMYYPIFGKDCEESFSRSHSRSKMMQFAMNRKIDDEFPLNKIIVEIEVRNTFEKPFL
jgi:hypothetical protein